MGSVDRVTLYGLMVKPIQRFPQFILLLQVHFHPAVCAELGWWGGALSEKELGSGAVGSTDVQELVVTGLLGLHTSRSLGSEALRPALPTCIFSWRLIQRYDLLHLE